ncbi:MAG: helix-turn-helix domain-containing protein [Hyphomicrobiaceae bacterium]
MASWFGVPQNWFDPDARKGNAMLVSASAELAGTLTVPVAEVNRSFRAPADDISRSNDILVAGFDGAPSRTLNTKEHLFCECDEASHVYLVEAGLICVYRMIADGRRQVLDFAYPGDVIGLGALDVHTANAQASGRSRVRSLSRKALHDIAARVPELGSRLFEALAQELVATREHLFVVSQCNAAERLASFLLTSARRSARRGNDPHELVLPMMRADIADYLGLTIETVSRTFSKFRQDGLIDIEQCVLVTILDLDGLAKVAAGGSHGA